MARQKRARLGPPDGERADALFRAGLDDLPTGYLHVARNHGRITRLRQIEMQVRGGSFRDRCLTLDDLVALLSRHRRTPRTVLAPHQQALLIADLLAHDSTIPAEFREVAGAAEWLIQFSRRIKQSTEVATLNSRPSADGPLFSAAAAKTRFPSLNQAGPFVSGGLIAFDRYMDRLKELKVYDEAGTYIEVARDLGGNEIPIDRLFPSRKRLVVEGFYLGSLIERQVFEKLFDAWDDVIWLLDIPNENAANEFGGGVYAATSEPRIKDSYRTDLAWLHRCQFEFEGCESGTVDIRIPHRRTTSQPIQIEYVDVRNGNTVVFPSSPLDEARILMGLAVTAYRDSRAQGAPARVTLAFPSDRSVAPLLASLADDAGIPLLTHAKTALLHVGSVRALIDLLKLRTQNFARDAVVAAVRAMRQGVPLDDDNGGRRWASAVEFDDVAREAHIIQGADEWTKRLANYVRSCALDAHPNSHDDDVDLARSHTKLDRALRVQEGWKVLKHILLWGDANALTIESFLECVKKLASLCASDHHLKVGLDCNDRDFITGAAMAWRADRFIVETIDAYQRCRPYFTSATRSFEAHAETFLSMLEVAEVPVRPDAAHGIELIGLRDLRGLSTDVLFVGGLVESEFPAAPDSIAPFSESEAARVGMRTRASMMKESEHLLVHAVHAAPRVVFSCSARDAAGTPMLSTRAYDDLRHFLLTNAPNSHVAVSIRQPDMLAAESLPSGVASALGRHHGTSSTKNPTSTPDERSKQLYARARDLQLVDPSAAWRAYAARFRRRGPPTRFDGMIGSGIVPWIDRMREGAVPISASSLDRYVRCPMAWFFERVLDVVPPKSLSRDLSSLERGSLIHTILERYERLKGSQQATGAFDAERLRQSMKQIADDELKKLPLEGLLLEIQRHELLVGLEATESSELGLLASYLRSEAERPVAPEATLCEVTFGQSTGSYASLVAEPITLEAVSSAAYGSQRVKISFRGAIDRIDLVEGDLVVMDYKVKGTGLRPGVKNGTLFQLPLYTRVVREIRQLLERMYPDLPWASSQIRGASYYMLNPSTCGVKIDCTLGEDGIASKLRKRSASPDALLGPGGMQALEGRYLTRAADVLVSMSRGQFHPDAHGDRNTCSSCDFNSVCAGAHTAERFHSMGAVDGIFEQVSRPPLFGLGEDDEADGAEREELS